MQIFYVNELILEILTKHNTIFSYSYTFSGTKLNFKEEKNLFAQFYETCYTYYFIYSIIYYPFKNEINEIQRKWSNEFGCLLFLGYYQPAGPLINSHIVGPQNLTKQPTTSPLDSESQQSSSVGEGM